MSPFAVKLCLLPFSSHCSTQNIGFSDFGYVIKPPQPSSAVYGAPPFTGHRYPHTISHRNEHSTVIVFITSVAATNDNHKTVTDCTICRKSTGYSGETVK